MKPKKYFYFAISAEENGKNYSYIMKISASENVKAKLTDERIKIAAPCSTKKNAAFLVNHWNGCHKANGTYLFDNPAF